MEAFYKAGSNYCIMLCKQQQTLPNKYGKFIKAIFSNKHIVESKIKLHIDPIFTYFNPEIASQVTKNLTKVQFRL